MTITNDMYDGLAKLEKWYRKYNHQVIDIAGVVGTGTWQLVQKFLELEQFDSREVMYLSYDQKQVLELAMKRFHSYYINRIIYNYNREVDFDTLPVINPHSNHIEYKWKKSIRKKIDSDYKIIIVFDSVLMDNNTIEDLCSFGLPIILLRDPMLLPVPNSYTFLRDPNILLRELHPDLYRNPIVYFSHKILNKERLSYGNYDTVSIVHKREMNLYNLKSSNMILTLSEDLRGSVNSIYKEKIMKHKSIINTVGERVIVMNNMYNYKLTNSTEKKIKVYLTKGTVGTITKCNRHVVNTKYVGINLKPEFYDDQFEELVMDRHYLNNLSVNSKQIIPDEIIYLQYAYALTPQLARISHWDKVTLILDQLYDDNIDEELQIRLLYTAITRSHHNLTIIM